MAKAELNFGELGGGAPTVKQTFTCNLTSNSYMSIGTITADGLAIIDCTDNWNMQWKNVTKGTQGTFTDFSSLGTAGGATASVVVSAGDDVQVNRNSGAERHLIINIVG